MATYHLELVVEQMKRSFLAYQMAVDHLVRIRFELVSGLGHRKFVHRRPRCEGRRVLMLLRIFALDILQRS